jgi:hypothetical protein
LSLFDYIDTPANDGMRGRRSYGRKGPTPSRTIAAAKCVNVGCKSVYQAVSARNSVEGWDCGFEQASLRTLEENEAHRRWGLLRMHVGLLGQEQQLRRFMWEVALNAAMNPLAPAGSSSDTLLSSFFLEELKESVVQERTVAPPRQLDAAVKQHELGGILKGASACEPVSPFRNCIHV